MITPLGPIWFTPSKGSKGFEFFIFHNLNHGKKPYDMGQLHGPWCKQILVKVLRGGLWACPK